MKIPTESRSSRSGGRDTSASGGSNGRDGSSSTNGGIGGIPRPHVTNSPSKLAVRTNTKLLAGSGSKQDGNSNGTGHHSRTSTANGDLRNGGLPEPSLRYGGGSNGTSGLVYKGGSSSSKTLVNDKLYPNRNLAFRSSSPPRSMGHSAHHQPSPQRSQTLSLIPSHQSSRLKTGSSSSSKSAVSQNITTTSSVRFSGVDHISSSTGVGVATTTTTTANSSSRSFSNGYHSSSLGSNTTTKGIMKTSSTPSPPSHSTNTTNSQYQHPFASNHNPQATTFPTPGPAYSIPQHASYPNGPSYSNVHNNNNGVVGQNGHSQQNGQIGHPNNTSSNSVGDNSRKFANFSSSSQMGSTTPSSNSHHVMTASSNHSAAVVTSSSTAGRTGSSSVPPPPSSSSSQLPTSGISGNNSSIKQQHNIGQPQHHGGQQLPHHGGQHHQLPHQGGQQLQQPHQGGQQHHQQQHSSAGHQSQQQHIHQQQGGGNPQVHHQHPNKYQHQGSGNKTGTLDHDRSTGSGASAQPSYRHPNFGGHHPFGPASNYAQSHVSNGGNQYSNNPSPMPHHSGSHPSNSMQASSNMHQTSSSMQPSSQHQSKPVFTQANDSIKPPTAYHPAPAYSKAMSSGLSGLSSSSSKPFPQQLSAALATASSGGINHHHLMHPAHPTPPPYQPPPPTPSILEPQQQPPTTVAVQTTSSSTQSAPVVREPIRYEGEDLSMVAHPDLCRRLITAKTELKKLSSDNNNYMTELNKKIQDLLSESQTQKDLNHRLTEDNQELRDLCCFLDDDRQKGRKLAREWQRFGRYTASVMRQEVSNYQTKLRDLDGKQQALVKDNLELKELCLYLDEERGGGSGVIPPPSSSGEPGAELAVGVGTNLCCECGGPALASPPAHPALLTATRDEGDGSSSSTNNDESEISGSNLVEELNLLEARESLYSKETIQLKYSGLNDDVLNYIRRLEDRLGISDNSLDLQSPATTTSMKVEETDSLVEDWRRPEAVSNALKVLSIQERILDRSMDSLDTDTDTDLGEGERAIVREMCNVVWKKLEEE